ncbi:trypsin-like serine protease [Bdellovibrio sp. NC01]|uniref:S1 family peptidase n=1 Tax=Bdellovibrio sp. NC01 TaxID=2220073 RepID=UPI00143CD62C|nr:serine protease [Bdellovibrio sp. NC01]
MKTISVLKALVLSLLLSACAENNFSNNVVVNSDAAIVGGDKVSSSDPIAARTVYIKDTNKKQSCSGIIISSRLILTAAHCVYKAKASDIEVRFGLTGRDAVKVAKQIEVHTHYVQLTLLKNMNDVALIQLASAIPSNYRITSILEDFSILKPGTTVTTAGYGYSNARWETGVGTLRKTNLRIATEAFSETTVAIDQLNTDSGSCHGDSGGPALVQTNQGLKVFGVANRITGKDKKLTKLCKGTAVYTRIDIYMPWILEKAAQLDPSARF